jgi:hypothetical protein
MPDETGRELATTSHQLCWSPRGLPRPAVDPALTELHPVVRAAEVLRYSASKFEYWISPGGHVREALRLSCLVAALLAIPVLLVMPLVTLLLVQVAGWMELIVTILINAACIVAALLIGKALIKGSGPRR